MWPLLSRRVGKVSVLGGMCVDGGWGSNQVGVHAWEGILQS